MRRLFYCDKETHGQTHDGCSYNYKINRNSTLGIFLKTTELCHFEHSSLVAYVKKRKILLLLNEPKKR